MRRPRHSSAGFTLVELVLVIIITGILAAIAAAFIRQPVKSYLAQSRRAELVDAAESAMTMMARDVRRALPNSLRVADDGTVARLEMINVVEAVRYRTGGPGSAARRLMFNIADDRFNVVGRFARIPGAFPVNTTNYRLAIYNLGQTGADAYAADGVITPAGRTITFAHDAGAGAIADEDNVTIGGGGHQFALESQNQRLFVVDGAIRYDCSRALGTLTRSSGYGIHANITDVTGVAAQMMATRIDSAAAGCSFNYSAGTPTREAVLTIGLRLTDSGESVTLLHQVHVDNVP